MCFGWIEENLLLVIAYNLVVCLCFLRAVYILDSLIAILQLNLSIMHKLYLSYFSVEETDTCLPIFVCFVLFSFYLAREACSYADDPI